jgi:acyl carrier protein
MTNVAEPVLDLEQRVIDIITKHQRLEPGKVTIDSTFAELSIDSLDGMELIFEFEEAFGIAVPDTAAQQMRSVRQVVDNLREVLREANPKAEA